MFLSIVSELDGHASIKNFNDFNFETVTTEVVKKEILNLDIKKILHQELNSTNISQQSMNIDFPAELKRSEAIPLFKKENPLKKENYRPVILLSLASKVFERIIYTQINVCILW